MTTIKHKSGRKKVADKKRQIPLFLRDSILIKHGGKDALRDKVYKFLGQAA